MFFYFAFVWFFVMILVCLFTILWSGKWYILGGMLTLGVVWLIVKILSINPMFTFIVLSVLVIFAIGYKISIATTIHDSKHF